MKKKISITKCIVTFTLTLCLTLGTIQILPNVSDLKADTQPTVGAPELGIRKIGNPTVSGNPNKWTGSYVYFGEYAGIHVKYRVLDNDTTRFSQEINGSKAHTMFLDCDNVLYIQKFDNNAEPNDSASNANEWHYSDIAGITDRDPNAGNVEAGLNDINNGFIKTSFTYLEREAIAESSISTHSLVKEGDENPGGYSTVSEWEKNTFKDYVYLTGEKIFILDVEDATNLLYGNKNDLVKKKNLGGDYEYWWLRSAFANTQYAVGWICPDGLTGAGDVSIDNVGVSPALNINHSSIVYSSVIKKDETSPSAGENNAEYKLTVLDDRLSVSSSGETTIDANKTVTVPFTLMDNSNFSNPEKLSVVVTDGTWTTGKGWSENAQIIKNENLFEFSSYDRAINGTALFSLDGISGTWGTDYNVYLIAEDINGTFETDYASEPFEISAPTSISDSSSWNGVMMVPENTIIKIEGDVNITGDVDLTLADGSEINISRYLEITGNNEYTLRIFGQSENTGKLSFDDLYDLNDKLNLYVYGGKVNSSNDIIVNKLSVYDGELIADERKNSNGKIEYYGKIIAVNGDFIMSNSNICADIIEASSGEMTINNGKIYVDSLLSQNGGISIKSGEVTVDSQFYAKGDIEILGGNIEVTGVNGCIASDNNIRVSGGSVEANSIEADGGDLTILGGKISATGIGTNCGLNSFCGNIYLSWSDYNDYIEASDFYYDDSDENKGIFIINTFIYDDDGTIITPQNIKEYTDEKLVPCKYIVTFMDGNIFAQKGVSGIGNGKVEEPEDPTKEGYDFDCWCLDTYGKNEFDFDTIITSNLELYARWIKHVTIKADDQTITYGDEADLSTAYSVSDNVPKSALEVTLSLPDDYTGNVGKYDINVSVKETDGYKIFTVPGTLTVNKATSCITYNPDAKLDLVYDGSEKELVDAGKTNVGKISYSLEESGIYSESIPVGIDAGKYRVYYKVIGNDNYSDTDTEYIDVEIAKKAITPEIEISDWTEGDTASVPTISGNAGNGNVIIEYKLEEADDNTYSETVPTTAGNYIVKATIAETTNYKQGFATANFTINAKTADNNENVNGTEAGIETGIEIGKGNKAENNNNNKYGVEDSGYSGGGTYSGYTGGGSTTGNNSSGTTVIIKDNNSNSGNNGKDSDKDKNTQKAGTTVTENTDGSKTETTKTENTDGSTTEISTTTDSEGNVLETKTKKIETTNEGATVIDEEKVDSNGNKTITNETINKDGTGNSSSITTDSDGEELSRAETVTTINKNKTVKVVTDVTNSDGSSVNIVDKTYKSGNTSVKTVETSKDGSKITTNETVKTDKKEGIITKTTTVKEENKKGKTVSKVKTTDTFSVNKKGNAKLTSISTNGKEAEIPDVIEANGKTLPVTTISKGALKGNKNIESAVIGENITTIGKKAFYGDSNLSSIELTSSVKKISSKAFGNISVNANFTIKASTEDEFNRVVKLIIDSGVSDTVTYEWVNTAE